MRLHAAHPRALESTLPCDAGAPRGCCSLLLLFCEVLSCAIATARAPIFPRGIGCAPSAPAVTFLCQMRNYPNLAPTRAQRRDRREGGAQRTPRAHHRAFDHAR